MTLKDRRFKLLYQLSKEAFSGFRYQILLLIGLGVLNGFLGGIGINAVIPLLGFVIGEGPGTDLISRTIRQIFLWFNLSYAIKSLLIFIVAIFLFKAAVLLICSYLIIRIKSSYAQRMQDELLKKTLEAGWPYLLKQKIGHLEKVLVADVGLASNLLNEISRSIITFTSLALYVLVAFSISSTITLIALALGAGLFLLFKPLVYRTRIFAKQRTKTWKEISHYINEKIVGLKTIKAMGVEREIARHSAGYFQRLKELIVKTLMLKDIPVVLMQPISLIFICFIFAFSYKAVDFKFAVFVAVLYLIQKILSYFEVLQNSLHKMNDNLPSLQIMVDYKRKIEKHKEKDKGSAKFAFNKRLEFSQVEFGYQEGKKVLKGLDFKINKGEIVGIIGPSGAGKTTIVDLLLRLFQPDQGRILLDEKEISRIDLTDWRENIGYVSQDIFLLNETIENNIKFFNNKIAKKEVQRAAQMANINKFIEEAPQGYQAVVGERGVLLSAGQRQRIVLARVLVREPQILILDEATSALDNQSEVLIQKAIKGLKGRVTILMIAHRLSSVLSCDKLLVLENGRIREQGRPQELLQDKKSYFYKVYNIRE